MVCRQPDFMQQTVCKAGYVASCSASIRKWLNELSFVNRLCIAHTRTKTTSSDLSGCNPCSWLLLGRCLPKLWHLRVSCSTFVCVVAIMRATQSTQRYQRLGSSNITQTHPITLFPRAPTLRVPTYPLSRPILKMDGFSGRHFKYQDWRGVLFHHLGVS